MFESLLGGFATVISPVNLLFCFFGVTMGTIIGVLPGVGPVAGTAMLVPFTFGMNPTTAIIMLAGIYYGAMYGGSTTSILVNLPGESSSVMTCLDGYQMGRKGRAGAALGIAAIGSFHRRDPERDRSDASGAPPGRIRDPFRPARNILP